MVIAVQTCVITPYCLYILYCEQLPNLAMGILYECLQVLIAEKMKVLSEYYRNGQGIQSELLKIFS